MARKADHHYRIWILHLLFVFACAVIIVIGLIWISREKQRSWRFFQYRGYEIFESAKRNDQRSRPASQSEEVITLGTWRSRLAWQNSDGLTAPASKFHELALPDLNTRVGSAEIPRKERCVTCHILIDWTGDASRPHVSLERSSGPLWTRPTQLSEALWELFPKEQTKELVLPVVGRANEKTSSVLHEDPEGSRTERDFTLAAFGFCWAKPGLLKKDEPRVGLVVRGSPSDLAGLRPGDLIRTIANAPVQTQHDAESLLFEMVQQSQSSPSTKPSTLVETYYPAPFVDAVKVPGIPVTLLRGLPQPWSGHPHQQLYVAEESSHPVTRFGCTICHDGQGLALDYAGAEHPSLTGTVQDWRRQDSAPLTRVADSVQPMILTELAESRCLRCHEKVFDLVECDLPGEPVAKNVVNGRRLVEQFGCYACHELQPRRATEDWNLTLSVPVQEVAVELLASPLVPRSVLESAGHLLENPNDKDRLHQLFQDLTDWQNQLNSHRNETVSQGDLFQARQQARQFVGLLRSAQTIPGGLPKVGPSLRYVASKLTPQALTSTIQNPQEARPNSRMPQIFGLVNHLSERTAQQRVQFEEVEIAGIATYLLSKSRSLPPLQDSAPSADRDGESLNQGDLRAAGRILFQTQGCLACHRHREFPEAAPDYGPDLSELEKRLSSATGRAWLQLWLTSPQSLSPATRMPQPQFRTDAWLYRLFQKDERGSANHQGVTPSQIIDALVAFLLPNQSPSQFAKEAQTKFDRFDYLDEVVFEYLAADLPQEKAKEVVKNGITVEDLTKYSLQVSQELSELLGEPTDEKKLRYVGRKAIGRYGCYGCHSISGFEGWPPIGPSLSQFGSKPMALFDFGAVTEGFLTTPAGRESQQHAETPLEKRLSSLTLLNRGTWVWLKLISPRAFDFKAMEGKPIFQHSRMGRFPLNGQQRQTIMTYILGLEGHPLPSKYNPYTSSRLDLAAGREIIERRGCDRCHPLRPEEWSFQFLPSLATEEMADLSQQASPPPRDAAGHFPIMPLGYALAVGYPERDACGNIIADLDELGNPLYFFTPWRQVRLGDHVWPVGEASLPIAATQLLHQRAQDGGAFALLLYPVVGSIAQQLQLTIGPREMWGCLPPNLYYTGEALQASWLAQYLQEPYPIRPAVPLAMPRYQLTDREIQSLIRYFSARAEKIDESPEAWKKTEAQLLLREQEWPGRLDAAWNLIQDSKTYCAKCHILGENTAGRLSLPTEAPRLDEVYRRLRNHYLRAWVANPKKILPYTAMPINFPADGRALDRSIFDADSQVQFQAVVDLLEHYDWYLRQRLKNETDSSATP
ncbi:MAG: hypothetical protein ACUVQH_06205 [Thermogutta sp.]